jgi:hypothetical protein
VRQDQANATVRRYAGEEWQIENISPTFHSGRQEIMVWGCFLNHLQGPLKIWRHVDPETGKVATNNPKITGVKYVEEILHKELLPYYSDSIEEIGYTEVYEDRAPAHKSHVARDWRQENCLVSMASPPTSMDLNGIENIWDISKRAVNRRLPTSVENLIEIVKEEWLLIPRRYFAAIVESMPARMQAALDVGGGPTRY